VLACGPVTEVLADVRGTLSGREDAAALLDGHVVAAEAGSGLFQVAAGGFLLRVPSVGADTRVSAGVRLKIPAREVMLAAAGTSERMPLLSVQNLLPARVVAVSDDAARGVVTVSLRAVASSGEAGGLMLAQVTADSARRLSLAPGLAVLALVKSVSIVVMTA
jgi:molybdate transport system ATP-binding protein